MFFRASTRERARDLGVTGWVRNRPDGAVEVHAAGDAAAMRDLEQFLAQGPPTARVTEVEVQEEAGGPWAGFEIRH